MSHNVNLLHVVPHSYTPTPSSLLTLPACDLRLARHGKKITLGHQYHSYFAEAGHRGYTVIYADELLV
jgi:hypothetical protein